MNEMIDDSINSIKNNSATIIQKYLKGYLARIKLRNKKNRIRGWIKKREKKEYKGIDILPKRVLRKKYQFYKYKMIDHYEDEIDDSMYIGRIEGFPDYISENIVLYALRQKNINCTWNTKTGDLYYFEGDIKKLGEVKCAQNGPSSLSPSSTWDTFFFIDAKDHLVGNIKIYMIKDIYDKMKAIKISKTQTNQEQSDQGKRPRSDMNILLSDYIKPENILFDGKISSLIY